MELQGKPYLNKFRNLSSIMWTKTIYACHSLTNNGIYFDIRYYRGNYIRIRFL